MRRTGTTILVYCAALAPFSASSVADELPDAAEQPSAQSVTAAAPEQSGNDPSPRKFLEITRTKVVPPKPINYRAMVETATPSEDAPTPLPEKYAIVPGRVRLANFSPYPPTLGTTKPVAVRDALQQSAMFLPGESTLFDIDTTKPLRDIGGGNANIIPNSDQMRITNGAHFSIDDTTFRADSLFLDMSKGTIHLEDGVEIESDGAHLRADMIRLQQFELDDELTGEPIVHPLLPFGQREDSTQSTQSGAFEAVNLELTEDRRSFVADRMAFNSVSQTGQLDHAHGHSEPFYFSAETIRILGPDLVEADDLWITTCDLDPPHYRIRISDATVKDGRVVGGKNARLQLGKIDTPLFIPSLSGPGTDGAGVVRIDFDSGSKTELGAYANLGQWFAVTPNIELGLRTFPTSREGFGGGIDGEYDFMNDPTSPLFRGKGRFESLYTTEERGYHHWYHRQGLGTRTELIAQWEQWYDAKFYKDFYSGEYEDRTGPRTFTNVTHLTPSTIWSATASKSTHDFTPETEKLPDVSYHVLERPLGKNFYLTMDATAGHYNSAFDDTSAQRVSQTARLSYDLNVNQAFNVVPFIEGGATYYSDTLVEDEANTRWLGLGGVTAQTRLSRSYRGFGNFAGLKHIIVPSVTYVNQDRSSLREIDVPRFDAIDDRPTRERIESKIDNIILGRNTLNGETWRLARLAFYQGYDLANDAQEATDYEVDVEIRPRPWWGFRGVGEIHELDQIVGIPGSDLNSVLGYMFYDDGRFENRINGQLGYALTEVDGESINREVLYGLGYKFSPNWSASLEHRYDLDRDELSRQSYEVRRRLHKWEMGMRVRDRELGTDFSIVFSLIDIAGAELRL